MRFFSRAFAVLVAFLLAAPVAAGWAEPVGQVPNPALTPTSQPTATASATVNTPTTAPTSTPTMACTFELGFKQLHDQPGVVVGDCRGNELHADNGDALQQTSGGLLVWRKADNWTAFTDGSTTWINGPDGLVSRPNSGPLFPWEASPSTTASLMATSLTAPDERPTVAVTVGHDPASPDGHFEIRLQAESQSGLARIWWWASGTADDQLSASHAQECAGQPSCSGSWTIGSTDAGAITIHARARDLLELESDSASTVLSPSPNAPSIELTLRADPTDPAGSFAIILDGHNLDESGRIWWSVPDSDDSELRREHAYACAAGESCRRTWQISTEAGTSITVNAQAEDGPGNRSDIARGTIRLKNQPPLLGLELDRSSLPLGDTVRVSLDASDDVDGVWLIELEALDQDSGSLVNSWELSCDGELHCPRTLSLIGDGAGTFTLRARAWDRYGAVSQDVTSEVVVQPG